MAAVKDASGLYEVERRAYHAARPGFRIAELQIIMLEKHLPCFSFSRASVSTTLFLSPESRLLAQNSNSLSDWRIEDRTVAVWKHLTIPKRGP